MIGPPVPGGLSTELSTGFDIFANGVVDDLHGPGAQPGLGDSASDSGAAPVACLGMVRWLGLVVPKRHAKRAVTRTLVKRQIRQVVAACAPRLAPGLWVVRQRSPFDPKQYPSAASEALKEVARTELRSLLERAARGERDHSKPRDPNSTPRRGKSAKAARLAKPAGHPAGSAKPVKPADPGDTTQPGQQVTA
jgi:ribonuclease P protein component